MAYGEFKVFPTRTTCDALACDKALIIAKYPKYDGYQRGLASVVCETKN